MRKKLVLFSLCSLISFSILAGDKAPFGGFHGDIAIGFQKATLKNSYTVSAQITDPLNPFTFSNAGSASLNRSATVGAITLGFSQPIHTFLMGIELRGNLDSFNTSLTKTYTGITSSTIFSSLTTLEMINDFSLLLKWGHIFYPNTLLYGLSGASFAKFNLSSSIDFTDNLLLAPSALFGSSSATIERYNLGLILGLGLDYLITPKASLGLEYTHTFYGTLFSPHPLSTPILENGRTLTDQTLTYSNPIKVNIDRFLVKLAYYFES